MRRTGVEKGKGQDRLARLANCNYFNNDLMEKNYCICSLSVFHRFRLTEWVRLEGTIRSHHLDALQERDIRKNK